MSIIDKFNSMALGKTTKIGLGLSDSEFQNLKILKASTQFLQQNFNSSQIYLFGNNISIVSLSNNPLYKKSKNNIILIKGKEPEKEIIEFLNNKTVNVIVRGSLSSSKFLENIKSRFSITEINRLALLETLDGFQFFFGPVGIDECNNYETKVGFIKKAIQVIKSLNITPKISVLSGGRTSDLGRNPSVDDTIKIANNVVDFFTNQDPDLDISHDEILIENAVKKESNLIIAPEGISGNLIYRVLVHLGGGKAHGAIYMGLDKVIIDTSRVGSLSEIQGALLLALALS